MNMVVRWLRDRFVDRAPIRACARGITGFLIHNTTHFLIYAFVTALDYWLTCLYARLSPIVFTVH